MSYNISAPAGPWARPSTRATTSMRSLNLARRGHRLRLLRTPARVDLGLRARRPEPQLRLRSGRRPARGCHGLPARRARGKSWVPRRRTRPATMSSTDLRPGDLQRDDCRTVRLLPRWPGRRERRRRRRPEGSDRGHHDRFRPGSGGLQLLQSAARHDLRLRVPGRPGHRHARRPAAGEPARRCETVFARPTTHRFRAWCSNSRDGLTGKPITADQALPGHYGPGPIRTTTDAGGYYEFAGLQVGQLCRLRDPSRQRTSTATTRPARCPGLPSIAASRSARLCSACLTVDPNNDAIVRIGLPPGVHSRNNNFSEVRVAGRRRRRRPRPAAVRAAAGGRNPAPAGGTRPFVDPPVFSRSPTGAGGRRIGRGGLHLALERGQFGPAARQRPGHPRDHHLLAHRRRTANGRLGRRPPVPRNVDLWPGKRTTAASLRFDREHTFGLRGGTSRGGRLQRRRDRRNRHLLQGRVVHRPQRQRRVGRRPICGPNSAPTPISRSPATGTATAKTTSASTAPPGRATRGPCGPNRDCPIPTTCGRTRPRTCRPSRKRRPTVRV